MTDWITSGTWDLGDKEKQRMSACMDALVDGSVLDLGCRDGTFALTLAKQYPKRRVVGIDLSEKDIAWANEQAIKMKLENCVFHVMDLFNAPSLGKFDTVVFMETLEHLPPNRVDEAFNLALGMAEKRFIVTVPANSHISDPDHKSVLYREQFHGRVKWIPDMPRIWLGFYIDK